MLLNTNKIGVATTRAIAMTINVQLLTVNRETILFIGKKANFLSLMTITIEFYQRSEQAAEFISALIDYELNNRIIGLKLIFNSHQTIKGIKLRTLGLCGVSKYLTRYIKV